MNKKTLKVIGLVIFVATLTFIFINNGLRRVEASDILALASRS